MARIVGHWRGQWVRDGNRLKYGKRVVTELEIVDDQMRGPTTDGAKISLTKQAPGLAQPARDPSFTGEWRFNTGGILVIEQEGMRLQVPLCWREAEHARDDHRCRQPANHHRDVQANQVSSSRPFA
jgi:hypothetical protein